MNSIVDIIVADRNPHVRRFLKRELEAEGYRVRLVENGPEVLKQVFGPQPLDLLILDPDLPGTDASALLDRLAERFPPLPVVVHTFLADYDVPETSGVSLTLVEKAANSAEVLKAAIRELRADAQRGNS